MLTSLFIKNYALISSLELKLNKGFTIITGETGAGKSILLGALSLILGNRADTSVLKNKEEQCVVEGVFDIQNFDLKDFFATNEEEIPYDPQTIIRRVIYPNGKSRAFINDSPVNLQTLRTLGYRLVDIHSQHENLLLTNLQFQLKIVDIFAQNAEILEKYSLEYKQFRNLSAKHKAFIEQMEQAKADYDYIHHRYKQLSEASLNENEQEDLESELKTLSHVEEIKRSLSEANIIFSGDDNGLISKLKTINSSFLQIANYFPPAVQLSQRIDFIYVELKDIAADVFALAADVEFDPQRAETINRRLNTIFDLQQKHRVTTVRELLDIQNNLELKLREISDFDYTNEQLVKELELSRKALQKIAEQISQNRKKALPQLEKRIIQYLNELGMPNAKFKISQIVSENFSENGIDTVNFLFSANKASEMQDITKVASGGEISRVMLSLKALIANFITLPTIIFDEIDTGVSGDIADKMGGIMHQMAKNMQVISITHLPQVAAKGDFHYRVFKKETTRETITNIELLTQNDRINELAKMLSGKDISTAALDNAKALLLSASHNIANINTF